jgi:hypothetical protein
MEITSSTQWPLKPRGKSPQQPLAPRAGLNATGNRNLIPQLFWPWPIHYAD